MDLPIRLKGNSKRISGFWLSVLGAQNKDIGAALQTLLTGVKLRLRRRQGNPRQSWYLVPAFVSGTSILGPVA